MNSKKRRIYVDILKDLSFDELTIIFKYCDSKAVYNFIQTKKEIFFIFQKLRQESIESIRLWYLNDKKTFERKPGIQFQNSIIPRFSVDKCFQWKGNHSTII
jgi:hypothetical protein